MTPADDLTALGNIVLSSYRALAGHPDEPDYELELTNIAERITTNTVFGAFGDGRPLGCVTFVGDASEPHAEDLRPEEASFRMLGVAPDAQGRGIGRALVRTCLSTARDRGKRSVFIYSGDWMTTAHRLYDRVGFRRVPDRDWMLEDPPITLLGFEHDLEGV